MLLKIMLNEKASTITMQLIIHNISIPTYFQSHGQITDVLLRLTTYRCVHARNYSAWLE